MRKLTTAIICTVFVLMLAVPVFAAGQLQFTVTPSVTQAAPGDTVEFEVSVKGDAYSSLGYIPAYDENVWGFLKGECLPEDSVLDSFSPGMGGVLAFENAAARDGAVFRFTMEVKSDAPAGKTTLTGTVAANDGGTALNTFLVDTVITIQSQNAAEPVQTEATKATESTASTEQTQPAPPDNTAAATQPTASSQGTDPTQATATEQTLENKPTEETTPNKDSTLTIGEGTIPDLEGEDTIMNGKDDAAQEADSVPKGNDSLFLWIAAIAVVTAGTAAAWFFLRKK